MKKSGKLSEYTVRHQARLLPLLWSYAKQHLPDLKETTKFSKKDDSLLGHCIGFAVTLAESIGKNQLNSTLAVLDRLILWEDELLSGHPIPQDPELDAIITSVVGKQSNNSTGPVMVVGDFKDSAFSESCQWLQSAGDTLILESNYEDTGKETHAIAVTLMPGETRKYCLIDANGAASGVLGYAQNPCSMALETENPEKILEFIKTALSLQKGVPTTIHFLSFNGKILKDEINIDEFYQNHLASFEEKGRKISMRALDNLQADAQSSAYYKLIEGISATFYPDTHSVTTTPEIKTSVYDAPLEAGQEEIPDLFSASFYPCTETITEKQKVETQSFSELYGNLGLLCPRYYPTVKTQTDTPEPQPQINRRVGI